MKFNLRPAQSFTFCKLFTICSEYCLFRRWWFSHPCQELQVEKLHQEVRLISTSSIIAWWVLPANIDARHFPKNFSEPWFREQWKICAPVSSVQWAAQHTWVFRRDWRSRQDRDLRRAGQGGHRLTYREPQRRICKDGSWDIWQASSRAEVTRDLGKPGKGS